MQGLRPREGNPFVCLLFVAIVATLASLLPGSTRAQSVEIVHAFDLPPGRSFSELCEWNGTLYGTTLQGGDHDEGTIFRVTPAGAFEVLHSLGGPGGAAGARLPWGGLVCLPDGNGGVVFYGTSGYGGASDRGTIFRLVPGGSPEVVHSFTGGPDGAIPQTTLTPASDGYLYGTTMQGASGRGTVFRFLPSAGGIALETLHSFPIDFVSGEIVEGPDALYVPTYRPVAGYVTGAIYRITRGATPAVSVFVEIRADGPLGFLGDPRGLVATSRALYLTTRSGYFSANGTVIRIPLDLPTVELVHRFGGETDGRNPLSALVKESETVLPGSTVTRLLGTTDEGGPNRLGTAFRIEVREFDDGTFTSSFEVVDTFERYEEGRGPLSTLVRGPDGAFYGTTADFSVGDRGAVYRLGVSGLELVHAFGHPQPGQVGFAPVGLAWGQDDRIIGVTWEGGDDGEGTAYSLDPTTLAGPELVAPVPGRSSNLEGYELQAGRPVLAPDGYFYTTTRRAGQQNRGAIVRFDSDSTAMETVHSFSGTADGYFPQELTLGDDGRLYGVTFSGTAASGAVYAYDPRSGQLEVLWSFVDRANGATPFGTLVVEGSCVVGESCVVYGVTNVGGTNNHGVVYRLIWDGSAWTQDVLHRFTGVDGSRPLGGLLLVSDGRLYGTTAGSGAPFIGSVFRMGTDGSGFETLHSFTGDLDGCDPVATLAEADDGWLYGTTFGGYYCQLLPGWWGSIYRVEPATGEFDVVHTFDRWNGANPSGALLPTAGGLFGTASAGGPHGGGVLFSMVLASADAGGSYVVDEGGSVELSATSDPAGADFAWDLDDDGGFDDGFGPTATFSAAVLDGPDVRTVRVRATFASSLSAEDSATVEVVNVPPTVDAGADPSLIEGETLARIGSFSDPGPDGWTGRVDWGQGAGPEPLSLSGTTFTLSRLYPSAGDFDLIVEITDDDGGVGTDALHVSVASLSDSLEDLIEDIEDLVDGGRLNGGQGNSLITKLEGVLAKLAKANLGAAVNQLEAFINEVEAYVESGKLTPAEGQPLIDAANRIIAVLVG
jgi:uncharacterized repeat protein (TIGR03803 family)